MGDNKFIFQFNIVEDKRRILVRGPWHYDNLLIVIEEPKGVGDVEKMRFNKAIFWIQIHNILILCMNKETGLFLVQKVEIVKEIDMGVEGDCLGKFIRAIVEVDVSKPLERCFDVDTEGDKPFTVFIMYERLSEYCFDCGLIGHTNKECPTEDPNRTYDPKRVAKYADWLKVPFLPRFRKNPDSPSPSKPKSQNSHTSETESQDTIPRDLTSTPTEMVEFSEKIVETPPTILPIQIQIPTMLKPSPTSDQGTTTSNCPPSQSQQSCGPSCELQNSSLTNFPKPPTSTNITDNKITTRSPIFTKFEQT